MKTFKMFTLRIYIPKKCLKILIVIDIELARLQSFGTVIYTIRKLRADIIRS